jgi:hypothetical protein
MSISQDELFAKVIEGNRPKPRNTFSFGFADEGSLKELFEFLLEFFTDLCKHFHGDEKGQVDINAISPSEFERLNQFMESIGITVIFSQQPATYENCLYFTNNRYDRVPITPETQLVELVFAIKCAQTLNIVQFSRCD